MNKLRIIAAAAALSCTMNLPSGLYACEEAGLVPEGTEEMIEVASEESAQDAVNDEEPVSDETEKENQNPEESAVPSDPDSSVPSEIQSQISTQEETAAPTVDTLFALIEGRQVTAIVNREEVRLPVVKEGMSVTADKYTATLTGSIEPYINQLKRMPAYQGKTLTWDRTETISFLFSRSGDSYSYMGGLTFFGVEAADTVVPAPEGKPSFSQIGTLYGVLEYGGYMNSIEVKEDTISISDPVPNEKEQSTVTVSIDPKSYLKPGSRLVPEKSVLQVVCTWDGEVYMPSGAFIIAAEDVPEPAAPTVQEAADQFPAVIRVVDEKQALISESKVQPAAEQLTVSAVRLDEKSSQYVCTLTLKNPASMTPADTTYNEKQSKVSTEITYDADKGIWQFADGPITLVFIKESTQNPSENPNKPALDAGKPSEKPGKPVKPAVKPVQSGTSATKKPAASTAVQTAASSSQSFWAGSLAVAAAGLLLSAAGKRTDGKDD